MLSQGHKHWGIVAGILPQCIGSFLIYKMHLKTWDQIYFRREKERRESQQFDSEAGFYVPHDPR